MTDIIYGVYVSGGSYDDHFHNVVKCWSTLEDANEHIKKLEADRVIKHAAVLLRDEFRNKWYETNPLNVSFPRQKRLRSWDGLRKSQITAEMRAEKAAADAEYNEACRLVQEARNALWEKGQEQLNVYLASKNLSPELIQELEHLYTHNTEVRYDVEEVELD